MMPWRRDERAHRGERSTTMPADRQGAPPAVLEYLARCGDTEELVVWWRVDNPRDPHEALWVITFNRGTRGFCVSSFPMIVSHWSHQLSGGSYDAAGLESQLQDGLWGAPASVANSVRGFLSSLA
jgi:hypothetical protein